MGLVRGLAALFGRPAPLVGQTPSDVVHEENKWRLLRYVPRAEGVAFRTPVLLIPSLINRHYVRDLMPGKSFAESLVAAGHDVYVIDWGTPEAEDRFVSFEDIVVSAIGRALRVTTRTAGADAAHVLGYCLGGTLAVLHAALDATRIRSLTLVAAPIDFHDDGLLSRWTRTTSLDTDALVEGAGNVPWQLMLGAFQLLRPTLPLVKAVSLAQKAWDEPFLDGFFAVETWGNDNVSFPGSCWRTYVEELYRKNAEKYFYLWEFAYSIIKEHQDDNCHRTDYYTADISTASRTALGASFVTSPLPKVEVRGLEPLTPWLQTMCSAS